MSLTVTVSQGAPAFGNRNIPFTVTVLNNSSSSVILASIAVAESTESDCTISQPTFLFGPPTLGGLSSMSFPFNVVFPTPQTGGPSPQQPPNGLAVFGQAATYGAAGEVNAMPADPFFTLMTTASASDGSVGSTSTVVEVLSATDVFPRPEGGALEFRQGNNLINGLIMGVL